MLLKSLVEVFVILSSSTSFSKASAATAIRAPSDPSIFEFTDVFVREIEQDTFESALSRRVATTVTFDDLPQPVDINARYMPESYGGLSWSTSSAYIRSSAHIIASSSPPHALYAVVGPEADGTEVPVISGKGIRMISFNCASLEKKQYDGREGQLISVFGKASHQDPFDDHHYIWRTTASCAQSASRTTTLNRFSSDLDGLPEVEVITFGSFTNRGLLVTIDDLVLSHLVTE